MLAGSAPDPLVASSSFSSSSSSSSSSTSSPAAAGAQLAARCSSAFKKHRSHELRSGFTAGSDLTDTHNPQHDAQTSQSHTHTDTHTHTHTHTHMLTVSHHAGKSGRDLTVKVRLIAVDSQQETSNCWLFFGLGRLLCRAEERQQRENEVSQHVRCVGTLERKVIKPAADLNDSLDTFSTCLTGLFLGLFD